MRSTFALGVLAIAVLSVAQDQPQQNYPYTINPDDVPSFLRETWCQNQRAQCPLICLQQPGVTTMTTKNNDCDSDTLVYSCVCINGVEPNITQYSQTIPYYVCTEWGTQCQNNCPDDTCKDKCRKDHPCGAQSPPPANTSIPTVSSTAAASKTGDPTKAPTAGFLGETSTPNNKNAASAMLDLGQSYSMAVVFVGVFAGFAILL